MMRTFFAMIGVLAAGFVTWAGATACLIPLGSAAPIVAAVAVGLLAATAGTIAFRVQRDEGTIRRLESAAWLLLVAEVIAVIAIVATGRLTPAALGGALRDHAHALWQMATPKPEVVPPVVVPADPPRKPAAATAPPTHVSSANPYTHAGGEVLCKGERLGVKDADFSIVELAGTPPYGKTAVSVFFGCRKLDRADAASFQVVAVYADRRELQDGLCFPIACDDHRVYLGGIEANYSMFIEPDGTVNHTKVVGATLPAGAPRPWGELTSYRPELERRCSPAMARIFKGIR